MSELISSNRVEHSTLISGKEAKLLLAQGNYVEYLDTRSTFNKLGWGDANDLTGHQFSIEYYKFRLKPRTITINNIEVPATFEPKCGDRYWYLDDSQTDGFGQSIWQDHNLEDEFIGKWRTESDITQVVAALRQVFKGNQ